MATHVHFYIFMFIYVCLCLFMGIYPCGGVPHPIFVCAKDEGFGAFCSASPFFFARQSNAAECRPLPVCAGDLWCDWHFAIATVAHVSK